MNIAALSKTLPASVFGQLGTIINLYSLNTEYRLAHFLGQCSQESGEFKTTEENLNYSGAALLKEWPNHFNAASALVYGHDPERIANLVYANRMGNGNEASGDGWKHRGFGYIELTGKQTQARFACQFDIT